MSVIQISSREFRDKQASMFDLADKGEHIVILRGKKKAYTLTPVEEEDLYFTPEMLAKIDHSIQQAKEGNVRSFASKEELRTFLDSL